MEKHGTIYNLQFKLKINFTPHLNLKFQGNDAPSTENEELVADAETCKSFFLSLILRSFFLRYFLESV